MITQGPFDGELSIYRNGEWIMGINEPFIAPVLAAIDAAIALAMFPPAQGEATSPAPDAVDPDAAAEGR